MIREVRTRDWIRGWFATATYADPVTGMSYLSVGRTPMSARTALRQFYVNEPEIL